MSKADGNIILKVEDISKQYRLGLISSGTLGQDLNRWWHRVRGKDDPFLKIGEANLQDQASESGVVWALKDINFEVKEGEVLGIIGKNGAGKSTLLKILSRVTSPSTGSVMTKGRIASLLEVGTGFHPEMTGRENIYLNGAILGMTKAEIRSKEEEIIEFSGCVRYIDTPVKRYSSGMRVRLAFAVAAHLEPDILVIDEVLAVGDAEFQKKAVGKMQDISGTDGRTVLFVSHNMAAVRRLCSRAVLMKSGEIVYSGSTDEVVDRYLNDSSIKNIDNPVMFNDSKYGNNRLKLLEISVLDKIKRPRLNFMQSEEIIVKIKFEVFEALKGVRFNLKVRTMFQEVVFTTSSHDITQNGIDIGIHILSLTIPPYLLNSMQYNLRFNIGIPGKEILVDNIDMININIEEENVGGSQFIEKWPGVVCPKIEWKHETK